MASHPAVPSRLVTLLPCHVRKCMTAKTPLHCVELPTEQAGAVRTAKPLRMKVPKSKQRALIREFGLDASALSEEEAAKRRAELKALVKTGKTRGYLTQQEINDHLPENLIDAEVLEATVKMLDDMGIAVY